MKNVRKDVFVYGKIQAIVIELAAVCIFLIASMKCCHFVCCVGIQESDEADKVEELVAHMNSRHSSFCYLGISGLLFIRSVSQNRNLLLMSKLQLYFFFPFVLKCPYTRVGKQDLLIKFTALNRLMD